MRGNCTKNAAAAAAAAAAMPRWHGNTWLHTLNPEIERKFDAPGAFS